MQPIWYRSNAPSLSVLCPWPDQKCYQHWKWWKECLYEWGATVLALRAERRSTTIFKWLLSCYCIACKVLLIMHVKALHQTQTELCYLSNSFWWRSASLLSGITQLCIIVMGFSVNRQGRRREGPLFAIFCNPFVKMILQKRQLVD